MSIKSLEQDVEEPKTQWPGATAEAGAGYSHQWPPATFPAPDRHHPVNQYKWKSDDLRLFFRSNERWP